MSVEPIALGGEWKLQERYDFKDKPHINYDVITGSKLNTKQKEFYDSWVENEPTHQIELTGFELDNFGREYLNKLRELGRH